MRLEERITEAVDALCEELTALFGRPITTWNQDARDIVLLHRVDFVMKREPAPPYRPCQCYGLGWDDVVGMVEDIDRSAPALPSDLGILGMELMINRQLRMTREQAAAERDAMSERRRMAARKAVRPLALRIWGSCPPTEQKA